MYTMNLFLTMSKITVRSSSTVLKRRGLSEKFKKVTSGVIPDLQRDLFNNLPDSPKTTVLKRSVRSEKLKQVTSNVLPDLQRELLSDLTDSPETTCDYDYERIGILAQTNVHML